MVLRVCMRRSFARPVRNTKRSACARTRSRDLSMHVHISVYIDIYTYIYAYIYSSYLYTRNCGSAVRNIAYCAQYRPDRISTSKTRAYNGSDVSIALPSPSSSPSRDAGISTHVGPFRNLSRALRKLLLRILRLEDTPRESEFVDRRPIPRTLLLGYKPEGTSSLSLFQPLYCYELSLSTRIPDIILIVTMNNEIKSRLLRDLLRDYGRSIYYMRIKEYVKGTVTFFSRYIQQLFAIL